MNKDLKKYFVNQLFRWHKLHPRPMPWSNEKDPYLIWISEIILQQTRVAQGWDYYLKFKEKFPNVKSLALASLDDVMHLWQGMGYYSRARNLHASAQTIVKEWHGVMPQNYKDLLRLKGIGAYTAAAIASFAYAENVPVIDGNVYRILSRYFGVDLPIDTTKGKNEFFKIATALIEKQNKPGVFNQAIMNFGALQCLPKNPLCATCPMQQNCVAFHQNLVSKLPVKSKKNEILTRYFNFFILKDEASIFLEKRTANDIWNGLYTLPLIESFSDLNYQEIKSHPQFLSLFGNKKMQVNAVVEKINQRLTHQKIVASFFVVSPLKHPIEGKILFSPFEKIELEKLNNFAFPKMIFSFLSKNVLNSTLKNHL